MTVIAAAPHLTSHRRVTRQPPTGLPYTEALYPWLRSKESQRIRQKVILILLFSLIVDSLIFFSIVPLPVLSDLIVPASLVLSLIRLCLSQENVWNLGSLRRTRVLLIHGAILGVLLAAVVKKVQGTSILPALVVPLVFVALHFVSEAKARRSNPLEEVRFHLLLMFLPLAMARLTTLVVAGWLVSSSTSPLLYLSAVFWFLCYVLYEYQQSS
jgi:hypothetical protein